jgi:hypothetical protein
MLRLERFGEGDGELVIGGGSFRVRGIDRSKQVTKPQLIFDRHG